MKMVPIVNGLEAEFGSKVKFLYLNIFDGAVGENAFHQLGLGGEPAVLIFDVGGQISFHRFGVFPAKILRDGLEAVLDA